MGCKHNPLIPFCHIFVPVCIILKIYIKLFHILHVLLWLLPLLFTCQIALEICHHQHHHQHWRAESRGWLISSDPSTALFELLQLFTVFFSLEIMSFQLDTLRSAMLEGFYIHFRLCGWCDVISYEVSLRKETISTRFCRCLHFNIISFQLDTRLPCWRDFDPTSDSFLSIISSVRWHYHHHLK